MPTESSLTKAQKHQNLATKLFLFQIPFIALLFLVTIASLGWTTHHFIIEEELTERAIQLAPGLSQFAANLTLSERSEKAVDTQQYGRNITDILYYRYYNAKDLGLLGQYVKETTVRLPALPANQITQLKQSHSEYLLLTTHTIGFVTSIRVLAPVLPHDKIISNTSKLPKKNSEVIGYIEFAMDLAPARKHLFKSILPVAVLLLVILISFVIVSRRYIHNTLICMLQTQVPLQRSEIKDIHVSDQILPDKTAQLNPHKNVFLARILIADDNEINRKLAVILLNHIGANIDQAENGLEAVTACKHNNYDLILMDIQMPVLDGIEATKQIRLLQQGTKKIPIIALTASALHGDKEHYIASGMDDYLAKPLTEISLKGILAKWCPAAFPDLHPVTQTEITTPNNAEMTLGLPVLDPKQGIALAFGQVDTWKTVLEMLLKSLPTLLNDMERSFDAKRLDEMQQYVHKLHGSSSYCGTPALQYASKLLEIACESSNIDDIAAQLAQVKIEMVALANLIELKGIPAE
ncbi:response regulator [Sulfurirhabdus autotrophica]|nr:response regulator [Sulfurirhabdus autotrophica]